MESKREPVDFEPMEREAVDVDMTAPTKLEKPEAPSEDLEKSPYKRDVKGLEKDEIDATELMIPKVEVSKLICYCNVLNLNIIIIKIDN